MCEAADWTSIRRSYERALRPVSISYGPDSIFDPLIGIPPNKEMNMARTLNHADYFGHARTRTSFATGPRKGVRGFFAKLLQAITEAKMKRIERELSLHSVRYRNLEKLL